MPSLCTYTRTEAPKEESGRRPRLKQRNYREDAAAAATAAAAVAVAESARSFPLCVRHGESLERSAARTDALRSAG